MTEESKLTLSIIKADVGGFVGHVSTHPDILDTAKEKLSHSKENGTIIDYHVLRCGDDLELIMTHRKGPESREIHETAWNVFHMCAEVAKELKLCGAGQDLSGETFGGSLKDLGPGVAEIEFVERTSEPVLIFMADKTFPGALNLPIFRIFADPFNTSGLILDPVMIKGFSFRVVDVKEGRAVTLSCPEELHYLLALIGSTSRYKISAVYRNSDGEKAAAVSTQKLTRLSDKFVCRDDPVCVIRCQSGFPAVGEVMEAFAFPHLVDGWMRCSHTGPLMPVPFYEANPTRFDGPPRVISAGFQISDGRLIGPHDMFDDPSYDHTRRLANEICDYMRRHGPFQPHRLPQEEMEFTTLSPVLKRLKDRFEKV